MRLASSHRSARIAATALLLASLVLWLPAIATPWWGDDYMYLQWARNARLAGESWLAPFWPTQPFSFWRPLSQETYWRFVEGVLGADMRWAHAANLIAWLVAAGAVGWLALVVSRVMRWEEPGLRAVLAAALYGALGLHFIPIHWVSAANSSMSVIVTAVALGCWLLAPKAQGRRRLGLAVAVVVLQAIALLTKESGVLLPLLMACMTAFAWPRSKPGRTEAFVLVACAVLIAGWLVLRAKFSLPTMPEYRQVLGTNVLRNIASLAAWLLNVPREALRLVATGQAALGLAWAAAAAIPMVLAAWIAARGQKAGWPRPWLWATGLFVVFAYAPYFGLAWQTYEYYAATAVILPVLLLAHGIAATPRRAALACALVFVSSLVAVQGSRAVDAPGLIGRARWAEAQLAALEGQKVEQPLAVSAHDMNRFLAIGVAGFAWRLGVPQERVLLVPACPAGVSRWLVQQADGGFEWRACERQGNEGEPTRR